MENSIESFIYYCDDYMEANEGLKDLTKTINNIVLSIRNSFKKINTWCDNSLKNINYFKKSKLDKKLNEDLKSVLKMSQPRTELNFKPIQLYYKAISIIKKDNTKVNRLVVGEVYEEKGYKEDFIDLVDRSNLDTMEAISAAKKSEAFKRITKNRYEQKDLENIPLNQIVNDIKNTNSMATTFSTQLNNIEKSVDGDEITTSLKNKMLSFVRTVISYCTFRIQILNKYLSYAKTSITGTINNLLGKGEKTKSNLKYNIPKVCKTKKIKEYEKFKKSVNIIRTTNDYNIYKKHFDYITKELGIENHVIKKLELDDQTKQVKVISLKDDGDEISVENMKLYHVSDNQNLTELKPFFRSKSGTTFFSTPRIYVHLNVPLNRLGSSIQMSKEKGDTVVYRISENNTKAKIDKEIGKTAVYIETTKPIKIRKHDYSKLKGAMTRKINNNIKEKDGN